ncbi:MAG TPA: amidase, partial [Acetobacteraceae bacterium]|nr:amidase [Acetobacteraceae bacterium]
MDPTFLPATQLAAKLRAGEIGCRELLDHYIARIERLDGRINAVVVRDFERARARARELDSQSDRSAPLHGVPMTVKESFDVAGLPSTRGHLAAKDRAATASSLSVQRLEAAGAVVFGKTNVPVDLADWQSYNPVYGATSNPWNLAHTPGGSSGGSAAALAAGFSALEIGTDIGGSIRVPAHFCGVFGHKPTWTLCPSYGDPLTSAAAPIDIAVGGPMARSAADLDVALAAMAGPDPAETALRLDLPAPRFTSLKELRVAVWTQEPGQETDAELSAKLEELADVLEREGATVSRTARPAFNATDAFHLYLKLLDAAWSARSTEELLAQKRAAAASLAPDDMSADAIMARCVDMPHRTWLGLNEQRGRLRRAWTAFFQEWDVLLCPPMATPALLHMQQGATWERRYTVNGRSIPYNDMLFWPGLTCGYHLPASVVPIGRTTAGLPVGVQIAGPLYGDRTTIAAARLLEEAGCAFVAPPGW